MALSVGPQEQDRVDLGQVDALVEQVDGEEDVDLAAREALARLRPSLGGAVARRHRQRRDAGLVERVGHELGVVDADAEAERPHPVDVGDLVAQRLQDDRAAGRRGRCRRSSVRRRRSPVPRFHWTLQVGVVVDAEVLERASRPRSSASHSRSSTAVRPSNQSRSRWPSARSGVAVSPSSTFGRRWRQEGRVGLRRGAGVVELVDDHHVEAVGIEVALEIEPGERLDRCEDVPPLAWSLAGDEALAERAVAHDVAEHRRGSGRGSAPGGRRTAASRPVRPHGAGGSRGRRRRSCRCRSPSPPGCASGRAPRARRPARRGSPAGSRTDARRAW